MMKRIFLFLALAIGMLSACSDDDSFTTSRNHLLTFQSDTVKMDTVFSNVGSSTYSLWVFNNSGDGLRIKTVRLRNANQTGFRVNVDGSYLDNKTGSVVNDLEVRIILFQKIDEVFFEPHDVVVCRKHHAHRWQRPLGLVVGVFLGFRFAVPTADAKMEQSVIKAAE